MAKIITFSRYFPAYHPKAGQETHFVEQFWNSLNSLKLPVPKNKDLPHDFMWSILPLSNYGQKHHTIRAGHRFKAGDYFSPRVWSGKPYRSKQIVIAPDTEVKKVWDVTYNSNGEFLIKGNKHPYFISKNIDEPVLGVWNLSTISNNDGLSPEDFFAWFQFPKPFDGQIICWNENVNY